MTMLNLFTKLKKYNKGNYRQFSFCYALSVILVSTLTLFMLSPFVQSRLPIGGDSRKMLYMVYAVAVLDVYCLSCMRQDFFYALRAGKLEFSWHLEHQSVYLQKH